MNPNSEIFVYLFNYVIRKYINNAIKRHNKP